MKNEKILNILLTLLVCASFISIFALIRQNSYLSDLTEHEFPFEVGDEAYLFEEKDIDNEMISIARTKALLIFLSPTCESCTRNLPLYQSFYYEVASENLQVIGVSTESVEMLHAMKKSFEVTFPIISDGKRKIFWEYKIKAVPTLILLDRDGKIAMIRRPDQSSDSFLQEVRMYLENETITKA